MLPLVGGAGPSPPVPHGVRAYLVLSDSSPSYREDASPKTATIFPLCDLPPCRDHHNDDETRKLWPCDHPRPRGGHSERDWSKVYSSAEEIRINTAELINPPPPPTRPRYRNIHLDKLIRANQIWNGDV